MAGNFRSILCYDKQTEHLVSGKKTQETCYHISNLTGSASEAAMAVRAAHWKILPFAA